MAPIAYIEHQIPGRLRLRIPEKRGDVAFFQHLVRELARQPGVTELNGSPLIGSICIHHSGPSQAIATGAAAQSLFEIGQRSDRDPPKKPSIKREPGGSAAPGGADVLDTIATGLSGLAVVQVARGEVTGSAAENFWNAYGAHRVLGSKEIVTAFALLGLYQFLQGQWLGSASSLLFYALAARKLASFDRAAGAMAGRAAPPKSGTRKSSAAKSVKKRSSSH